MENRAQSNLENLNFKDLMRELFEAVTDLEKSFFRTFWDLTVAPEKVINSYIRGNDQKYFKAFRYFIISIFVSYIGYSYSYSPNEIGGPFYSFILQQTQVAAERISQENSDFNILTDVEKFDVYHLEMAKYLNYFFKFSSCFIVLALFGGVFFFRKGLKKKVVSLFILSLFLASQNTLLSSIMYGFINLFSDDLKYSLIFGPLFGFLYIAWAMTRLLEKSLRFRILKSLTSSFLTVFFFFSLQMIYGTVLSVYIRTYTPNYYIKEYIDPATLPAEEEPATQNPEK